MFFNWFKRRPRYELLNDDFGKWAVRCNFGLYKDKLFIWNKSNPETWAPQRIALETSCWTDDRRLAEATLNRLMA